MHVIVINITHIVKISLVCLVRIALKKISNSLEFQRFEGVQTMSVVTDDYDGGSAGVGEDDLVSQPIKGGAGETLQCHWLRHAH